VLAEFIAQSIESNRKQEEFPNQKNLPRTSKKPKKYTIPFYLEKEGGQSELNNPQ